MHNNDVSRIAERIQELEKASSAGRLILAVDGRCAAGKTTLAARLQEQFGCTVFHMDDFFLRPEQRTEARYRQPGGNVDYERFREEVLLPLYRGADSVTYRPFDCKSQTLQAPVQLRSGRVNLVEGAYSCHPELTEFYDLRIFLDITGEEQMERIKKRNGENAATVFAAKWIPLEELYFKTFDIRNSCDMCVGSCHEMTAHEKS